MEFLDKDTEIVLQQCVNMEEKYPEVLRNMFEKCSHQESVKLRSILHNLIDKGYISKLIWADNLPYNGQIEQKGRIYFKQKDIFIRKALRENSRFNLNEECEKILSELIKEYEKQATPYALVGSQFYSDNILRFLNDKGLIEFGPQGISYTLNGDFTCMYAITYYGKTYFIEKENFIEEICVFPNDNRMTSIQIKEDKNISVISENSFDVFISHANADKLAYVNDLKKSLDKLKINIFYDKDTIEWGDDWKEKILTGVKKSKFAIIIISEKFFDREWTEKELKELLNRQNNNGERIILPILHQITLKQLQLKYPAIADIQALSSADHSCDEIALIFAGKLIKKLKLNH